MKKDNAALYKPWGQKINGSLILIVNSGSSSLKVTLFEHDKNVFHRLLDGHVKGLHSPNAEMSITNSLGKEASAVKASFEIPQALNAILDTLKNQYQISLSSLKCIGHRFVNGGPKYHSPILINNNIIKELDKLFEFAPLHNAACLSGIKTCIERDSSIPQFAVFDTSFHRTIPAVASLYALPEALTQKYQIERYGFHGISHEFLAKTYHEKINPSHKSKIITLHLGNGCSMAAILDGRSIDTSMGFTPTEGLIMSTRVGDIDPAVMEYLCHHDKKSPSEIMEIYNMKSGLLGISNISSDMQVLTDLYTKNPKARFAIDMFCYRITKYLGSYIAILKGVDAIIFSGGMGENSKLIRAQIIKSMEWYGIKIDSTLNEKTHNLSSGDYKKLSSNDSLIQVFTIGTDENLMIAHEISTLLK